MTELEKLHKELEKAEKSGDMVKWNLIAEKIAAIENEQESCE